MHASFLYCHTFQNCRCRCVEILVPNSILFGTFVRNLTNIIIAASFNASSPSLSYKVPAKSATITASPQTNSSNYVFGDCANASDFSPAYTTVTSLVNTCGFVIITAEAQLSDLSTCSVNTTIVSTIAPSTTCCTKCEVGADRVRLVYVKAFLFSTRSRVARHYREDKNLCSPQNLNHISSRLRWRSHADSNHGRYWKPDPTTDSIPEPTPYTLVSDNYTL